MRAHVRQYLSGYLGKARVVAFEGTPDRFDNKTWDIFVTPQEERPRHEPEVAGLVDSPADAF